MLAPLPATNPAKTVVLSVEDDQILQALVERVLFDAGFTVQSAPDAGIALEVLRNQPVDVLLTDIVMPGPLSGFDLAREATALNPKLKVVRTTSHISALDIGQAMLLKPYSPEQLIEAINQSLLA